MEKVPVAPDLNFGIFQNHDPLFVRSLPSSLIADSSDDYPRPQSSSLECGDILQASISTEPFSFGSGPPQSRQVSFNRVSPDDDVPRIVDENGSSNKIGTAQERHDRLDIFQFSGNVSPLSGEQTMLCEAVYPLLGNQEKPELKYGMLSSHLPPESSEVGNTHDVSLSTYCISAPLAFLEDPHHPDSLELIDKLMAGEDQGSLSPYRVHLSDEPGGQRHQRFVSQMLQIPSTPTSQGSPAVNQFGIDKSESLAAKVVREYVPNAIESKRALATADTQVKQEALPECSASSLLACAASCHPQLSQNQNPEDATPRENPRTNGAASFQMRQLSDYLKICGSKLQKHANAHTKSRLTKTELTPKANATSKSKRVGTAVRKDESEACVPRNASKRKPRTYSRPIPSQHCHICSRRPTTQSPHAACGNLARGKCRKTICQKCFTLYGWDMTEAMAPDNSRWLCPHCSGKCPDRAQCHIYDRTSERRRNNTVNHRKPKLQAKQCDTLNSAGARAGVSQPFGELILDSSTRRNVSGIVQSRDPVSGTTLSSITGSAVPNFTDSSRVPFACNVTTRDHQNGKVDDGSNVGPAVPEYGPGISPAVARSPALQVHPKSTKNLAYQRDSSSAGRTGFVPSRELYPSPSGDVLSDLMTAIRSDVSAVCSESVPAFDETSCQHLLSAGAIPGTGGDVFNFLFEEGEDGFGNLPSRRKTRT